MITAVDTNVLLDVLIPHAPQGDASEKALVRSLESGPVIVSEAVYAELAAHFPAQEKLDRFLEDTGIILKPSGAETLYLAGKAWREYLRRRPESAVCPSCGAAQDFRCKKCKSPFLPRLHVVADFLIGAHASLHADLLLTRDRGYYRTYFPKLRVGE